MKIAFNDTVTFNGLRYHAGTAVNVTAENVEAFERAGVAFVFVDLPPQAQRAAVIGRPAKVVAVAPNANANVVEVDSSNSRHKA